jgi:hypothetical protein
MQKRVLKLNIDIKLNITERVYLRMRQRNGGENFENAKMLIIMWI